MEPFGTHIAFILDRPNHGMISLTVLTVISLPKQQRQPQLKKLLLQLKNLLLQPQLKKLLLQPQLRKLPLLRRQPPLRKRSFALFVHCQQITF